MEDTDEIVPCIDKLVFDTKELAEGAAIYVKYRHGTAMRVYKCRFCHLWHLSSV